MIEEPSKMFAYFFYNLHPLFYLKVPKILFLNSWLFFHADDPLLQEISSELTKCQSGVGIRGHVELHPLVKGAIVTSHHAEEVLIGTKGLGHALRRWLNTMVGSVVVYAAVSQFPCDSPCRINILLFGSTPTISSLLFAFIFFHPHNFNFFIQIQNFENKRISIKVFEILRI